MLGVFFAIYVHVFFAVDMCYVLFNLGLQVE